METTENALSTFEEKEMKQYAGGATIVHYTLRKFIREYLKESKNNKIHTAIRGDKFIIFIGETRIALPVSYMFTPYVVATISVTTAQLPVGTNVTLYRCEKYDEITTIGNIVRPCWMDKEGHKFYIGTPSLSKLESEGDSYVATEQYIYEMQSDGTLKMAGRISETHLTEE